MDELDESEAVSRAARGRLSGLRISFLQPPVALQTRWNTKLRPNSYLRFSIFLPPRTGAAHATALGRAKALQAGSGNARGEWAAGEHPVRRREFSAVLCNRTNNLEQLARVYGDVFLDSPFRLRRLSPRLGTAHATAVVQGAGAARLGRGGDGPTWQLPGRPREFSAVLCNCTSGLESRARAFTGVF